MKFLPQFVLGAICGVLLVFLVQCAAGSHCVNGGSRPGPVPRPPEHQIPDTWPVARDLQLGSGMPNKTSTPKMNPVTVAAIEGGAPATLRGMRTGDSARRCNIMPDVWRAIAGCTGTTRRYRRDATSAALGYGKRYEAACAHCEAFKAASDSRRGQSHQDYLNAAQAAVYVEDYREHPVTADAEGRPVLVVTRGMVRRFATERAAAGDLETAALALLALDGERLDHLPVADIPRSAARQIVLDRLGGVSS